VGANRAGVARRKGATTGAKNACRSQACGGGSSVDIDLLSTSAPNPSTHTFPLRPVACRVYPVPGARHRARPACPRSPSAAGGLGLASHWSAGKPGRHQPTSRGLVCTCLVAPMVVSQWTGHRSYGGAAGVGRWSMCQMPTALPPGARGALGLCERTATAGATHR
jgi:hypothetical protein